MMKSGPLGFLFGGRKRNAMLSRIQEPVPDGVLTDTLHGATAMDGFLPDDILLEGEMRSELPMATIPSSPPLSRGEAVAADQQSTSPVSQLRTPVFIVGSPRSGTSILINGMIAAGYTGFREGNFLTLMRVFEAAADRHRAGFANGSDKVLATMINWDAFKGEIFETFKRHVDALNPSAPWMDKTGNPEMIEAIPQLRKLWPNAIFIFAKRRGIENVTSRLKKFPGHGFDYHCKDWAKNMAAWRAVRDHLGESGIEIDQQEIIRSPHDVAAKLAIFLNAGEQARDRIQQTFLEDRPQETTVGSASRVIDLDETGWTSEQRDTFLRLCYSEMEAFHYSTGRSYWN
jgi:hypothetical protein